MSVLELLTSIDIKYEITEHEPVFTAKQAEFIKNILPGTGCKNLFMKNKKGNFYLIIIKDSKKADIKQIEQTFKTSRLSFASEEELSEVLGLQKGSASPFGIINDKSNKTVIFIDIGLKNKTLLFHPNINTATISVSFQDLIKFIEYENHEYFLYKAISD